MVAPASVDLDALLCALTLVPTAFARNRFFKLFENPAALKVRRRASRVRGIIRQLCGTGRVKAEVILGRAQRVTVHIQGHLQGQILCLTDDRGRVLVLDLEYGQIRRDLRL